MIREPGESKSDRRTFVVGAAVGLTIGLALAAISGRMTENETNLTLPFLIVFGFLFTLLLVSWLTRLWMAGRVDPDAEVDIPSWAHLPSLLLFSVSFGLFCVIMVLVGPAIAGVLFGWSLAEVLPAIICNVLLFAPLRASLATIINIVLIMNARQARSDI